ncbi:Inosine-uridine preferring nucleoside hydrolase [Liparis tanakae]|uniref:Inosine-uridine preferring nucleoside hydrolase n=1 Tax=Liparis tanakae TaxID=230148 RepID=A0A4Z2GGQ1_9TELE|nr:Inosine-uridine preferring nucleoside hydrolase [Liparis tanakae]
MRKKLILDVDTGVDDAQAIMMALADPNVEILAITCSHGNTKLDNACKNTLRVLKVCDRMDIPVHRGCAEPVLGRKRHAGDFHGKDGLGDAPDPDAPGLELLQKRKAPQAIIKIVNANPGEVTLVATAPLTNLAVAAQLNPSFTKNLKALYIMGGNTESSLPWVSSDHEQPPVRAASGSWKQKDDVLDLLSVSLKSFCDTWLAQDTEKARFMEKISLHTRTMVQTERYQKELVSGPGFNTCDTYAVAAAIDDTLLTESDEVEAPAPSRPRGSVAVTVELEGTHTRGMMVLDYMGLLKKKNKVFIMKTIDLEKFKRLLTNALK